MANVVFLAKCTKQKHIEQRRWFHGYTQTHERQKREATKGLDCGENYDNNVRMFFSQMQGKNYRLLYRHLLSAHSMPNN